jgi:hypothetical protein
MPASTTISWCTNCDQVLHLAAVTHSNRSADDQVARLFRPKSHDTENAFVALGFTAQPLKQGVDALFRPQSEDPA